jgi:nucleoporin NUP159
VLTPTAAGVYWISNDEFLTIHIPKPSLPGNDDNDAKYHVVKTDKSRTTFSYSPAPGELLFASFEPLRQLPPRYTVTRLQKWAPDLDDLLILGATNSADFAMLTKTTAPIAHDQEVVHEYNISMLLDNRRATLPQMLLEEGGDTVLIGEGMDLSSTDKIIKPIPSDEEFWESPFPLPAFLALNHEGFLLAWYVVYDKSIREGTKYPGLVEEKDRREASSSVNTPATKPLPSALQRTQSTPVSAKQASTSSTPTTPGSSSTVFQSGNATFSRIPQPTFGQASPFGQSSQPASTFGKPSQPSSQPAQSGFGKPSQPGFGAPSAIGSSAFGAAGGAGNRPSPWGSVPQKPNAQGAQNPFVSQAGASGFAKFGSQNNTTSSTSAFSSFGSTSSQSPFSALGGQKPSFSGNSNGSSAFKGLNTAPSFGSTVSVGSSFGDGSTLPSWANTPAPQSGSKFGQDTASQAASSFVTSSFGSSKESDISDADDAQNRERDEATPTPQPPPQQPKNNFGLPQSSGFKLTPSFKGDGTAKDDLPKPPAPSSADLFGGAFASALGDTASKPEAPKSVFGGTFGQAPSTPLRQEREPAELGEASTTPAFPPKQPPQSKIPTPASTKTSSVGEDAPLPPDPMIGKPPKATDDDLPPIAGSPAIKIEAPDSDVPSSPLEDGSDKEDEDDFSVEEQDEEDVPEPSPSDVARKTPAQKAAFKFADSVNQSPQVRPAAPTPPAFNSGASSLSGDQSRGASRPPSRPSLFDTVKQTSSPSFFQQSSTPAGFPRSKSLFPLPADRAKTAVRSTSPVRPASASVIGVRRQDAFSQSMKSSQFVQQQPADTPPLQPELSDLVDNEDERIRRELASEIVPSRTLEKFIAHADYNGNVTKTGIAAQIEIMYRDMNGMVDTLGLNARSLQSFITYHQRRMQLVRDDLEEVTDQGEHGSWEEKYTVGAVEDLDNLESHLEAMLDEGRVLNVFDKLTQLARLVHDRAKLESKLNDIRRQLINRRDPERAAALRKASLPKELADQQKALRQEYARSLSLLGKAEEASILLKSKLASSGATNGRTGAVPTVDAVKKTINRLIQITEKKNNNILLLEAQLKKATLNESAKDRPSSSSQTFGTPKLSRSVRRLQQSPLTTPQHTRNGISISELNRSVQTPEQDNTPSKGYGLFYTPEGSTTGEDSDELRRLADKMENGDLEPLREVNRKRKQVASRLTGVILKKGVKVTKVAQP